MNHWGRKELLKILALLALLILCLSYKCKAEDLDPMPKVQEWIEASEMSPNVFLPYAYDDCLGVKPQMVMKYGHVDIDRLVDILERARVQIWLLNAYRETVERKGWALDLDDFGKDSERLDGEIEKVLGEMKGEGK